MEFVSVFDEASHDVEAEGRERAHTAATQEATAATWPFLAQAQSQPEFGHRLAMVEDRLSAIAAKHGVSLEEVTGPLQRGFEAVLTAQAAAKQASYEERGLHGVVGTPDRNEDGSPMRFQCPGCYDGAGGWYDFETGYQKCPACDGNGSVHRIPKVENPVHKADYHFVPAPRLSAVTSGLKCAVCGHSASEHRDGGPCEACGCKDFTPREKTAARTGPTIDSADGYEYEPAPEHVQRAMQRRFENRRPTAIDPKNPGQYLHGVDDWVNGAQTVRDNGDGSYTYRNPYSGDEDRFDEHGYYDHDGNHRTWGSQWDDMAPRESARQAFDARIAKIHQALEEGVDPLALVTEVNGSGSAPATPTHHMETQVFEGGNPVAFDAAQQGGGAAAPENAGGHSIAPQASREAHPFA